MMYPPKMYRSFLGNTSSVQVKYIICSIKIDDVFIIPPLQPYRRL